MVKGYRGSIFKNKKQYDEYGKIAIWGKYTPSRDPDYKRSESDAPVHNDAFWKKKLGRYNEGVMTPKNYESINAIADEDDLDYIRGMTRKKKRVKANPKRKKCKCK
jgi:hypothetical protein